MTQSYSERDEYKGHRDLGLYPHPKYRESRQNENILIRSELENLILATELGIVERGDQRFKEALGRLYENDNP